MLAEGGEARNHEAEVEAVSRALQDAWNGPIAAGQNRWGTLALAALDAVRCAQGRDTDAPERSPQGEDHEVALVAHAIEEALPFAVEARTSERVAEAVLSVLAADRNGEVDRLRAGISFVRGLCTERQSLRVIDERLGELLDGETK